MVSVKDEKKETGARATLSLLLCDAPLAHATTGLTSRRARATLTRRGTRTHDSFIFLSLSLSLSYTDRPGETMSPTPTPCVGILYSAARVADKSAKFEPRRYGEYR